MKAVSQDAGDQLSQMVTPKKKRPPLRLRQPAPAPAPASIPLVSSGKPARPALRVRGTP